MANANISLYAAGVVAGLETRLLSSERLKAMVEAENFDDSVKILYDSGFGAVKSLEDLKDFEQVLQKETVKSFVDLKRLSSDEFASEVLLLPFDYHNLKTLLKARAMGIPATEIESHLYQGSLMDLARLQVEVFEGGSNLRPHMRRAVEKIGASVSPQVIDTTVDIALYKDIAELLKFVKSKSVINYCRSLIDYINISTFVRSKLAELKDFSTQIIEGGNLTVSFFVRAANNDIEAFLNALRGAGYSDASKVVEESLKTLKNLSGYEKYYKTRLHREVRDKKDDINTLSPVHSYFLAKRAEIDNVRLVLTCKKNKVDKSMIYQRLRDTYA